MDIKIDGLKYEIMEAALAQIDGRLHILGIIETLASPKEDVKTYAPKLLQEEFLILLWCVDWTWWKMEITKTTGHNNINEDPITERCY
jgi:polyribonucleotide nucleotidyltransferase